MEANIPVHYECTRLECKYSPKSEGTIIMVSSYSEIIDKDIKCNLCGARLEVDLGRSLDAQQELIRKNILKAEITKR